MSENIIDDIDVDALAEMVKDETPGDDFQPHQEPQEPVSVERLEPQTNTEPEVTSEEEPAEDPTYNLLNQNTRLQKELEELKAAKEHAEMVAVQGAIRGFETQIEVAQTDIERLNDELVRARDDGDTARSVKIENAIRDRYERVRDLKGEVNKYQPLLNNYSTPKKAPEAVQQDKGLDLAQEWIQDNQSWLKDPKSKDKMVYAERKFKEMQKTEDMSKLSFWTKLDKEISNYEKTKENRMPKTMVAYNNQSSNTNSNKQADERDLIKKVAYIAQELAGRKDYLQNKEMFNSLLKQYRPLHAAGKLNIPVKL